MGQFIKIMAQFKICFRYFLTFSSAFISTVVSLFPYQAIIVCPPLTCFCLPSFLSSYLFLWSLISYFVVAKSSHGICYEPNFWLASFFLTFTGPPTTLKYFFHQLYQNSKKRYFGHIDDRYQIYFDIFMNKVVAEFEVHIF